MVDPHPRFLILGLLLHAVVEIYAAGAQLRLGYIQRAVFFAVDPQAVQHVGPGLGAAQDGFSLVYL